MNITKFFNLSILEIEEYLKSHQIYDLGYCRTEDTPRKMGLTGLLDYNHRRKIRVRKKSNLYGVYEVDLHELRDRFEISFSLYCSGSVWIMWLISESAEKIDYVKFDSEKYCDKTKTLAEIIEDWERKK